MQDTAAKSTPRTLRLNAARQLIVADRSRAAGAVPCRASRPRQRIMRGHKMAAQPIAKGEPVLKFGQIIGFASQDDRARRPCARRTIARVRATFERDYAFAQDARAGAAAAARGARHLRGLPPRQRQGRHAQLHRHPDHRELLGHGRPLHRRGRSTAPASSTTIPTSTASSPSRTAPAAAWTVTGEGFDDAAAHALGLCRQPQHRRARCWSASAARCSRSRALKEPTASIESDTFRTMTIQETGGTKKTVEAGVERIKEMLPRRQRASRARPCRPRELMLALQCGGSDGYSGITANPALGAAADLLVRHGGTAILSETPEIYGAEHLLTRRARQPRGRREAHRASSTGGRTTPRATTAR